ncbi:MAG TPA: glycosyltransferase [Tepidisphaeraceae bacterium]|jgi:GT2 family glycosyltransferase|nr:glycosyltransferase [Tepidisphaeraceae bacterium]
MLDVTFLISTYNRGQVLLSTLAQIGNCGLAAGRFEIIVVDNASTDGTADLVAHWFREVKLVRLATNRGPCAKNEGLPLARGRFVLFLDDDSFPQPGAVAAMIEKFDRDPELGAATFTITLPNGRRECSAYPNVFIGCGTGFRTDALKLVGGLPTDFFMQAEEYDLSLRLMDAGWHVRSFADLHVTHLKTPAARYPERVASLDVRNNLLLVARHFPLRWVAPFAWDWTKRYRFIAGANGRKAAFWRGVVAGLWAIVKGAHRKPVSTETFETFARLNAIEAAMRDWAARSGVKQVLFVDLGKNSLAYHRAARRCGLTVVAVADANLGQHGYTYRGVPIVTDDVALRLSYDAVVVSNLSPVHAQSRTAHWQTLTDRPVVDLMAPAVERSRGVAVAA